MSSDSRLNRESYSCKLRYLDMNDGNGGVARDTVISDASWVDLFSYTNARGGLLVGFRMTLETGADWRVRLVVDGDELFIDSTDGLLTNNMTSDAIYDVDPSGKSSTELAENLGLFIGAHDQFTWNGPLGRPVNYTESVSIKVKRDTGKATKKFKGGFIILTKD